MSMLIANDDRRMVVQAAHASRRRSRTEQGNLVIIEKRHHLIGGCRRRRWRLSTVQRLSFSAPSRELRQRRSASWKEPSRGFRMRLPPAVREWYSYDSALYHPPRHGDGKPPEPVPCGLLYFEHRIDSRATDPCSMGESGRRLPGQSSSMARMTPRCWLTWTRIAAWGNRFGRGFDLHLYLRLGLSCGSPTTRDGCKPGDPLLPPRLSGHCKSYSMNGRGRSDGRAAASIVSMGASMAFSSGQRRASRQTGSLVGADANSLESALRQSMAS